MLLVSSSGGVLLEPLALRPWWEVHKAWWAAVRAPDTEQALAGQDVHWIREQSAARPMRLALATLCAVRLLAARRPDVVLSAGSGAAVPFFLAARLLGVPAVWIETLNVIGRPGVAARCCARLAAAVLVQHEELVATRPHAVLVGELY